MQVNKIFYIHNTLKTSPQKENQQAAQQSTRTQSYQISELSNIYYMPVFTSNKAIEQVNTNAEEIKAEFLNMLANVEFLTEEDKDLPAENYIGWNISYVPLIEKQLNEHEDDGTIEELLRIVNKNSFEQYISTDNNMYSLSNSYTKDLFENKYDLDYNKWLHPSKKCEVQIKTTDNQKRLMEISDNIELDIELLRSTPAKKFIDKRIKPYLNDGKFKIPISVSKNKTKLYNLTDNILNQLSTVWNRAENHKNLIERYNKIYGIQGEKTENQSLLEIANLVLSIKNDLEQNKEEIQSLPKFSKGKNDFDLTIKMWERNPKTDLFEGNYSTCCIGMGAVNGEIMPQYLLHTCFNMIELVDNKTNQVIGNALCYFAEADRELSFIIDNVEMNKDYIPSKETGDQFRNAILKYSKNLLNEIQKTDKKIDIYMSYRRNDIPAPKELAVNKTFKFVGNIYSDIYLDLYDGYVFDNIEQEKQIKACKLT